VKKINFYYISLFFLFFTILFPSQSTINYQLKFANGIGDSDYFENYLNYNHFFDNGLYLYTQLEFSKPPLIGEDNSEKYFGEYLVPTPSINMFYIEYSSSNYDLVFGDLNLLYGRGLSIHTYEDQGIDYNNTIFGLEYTRYVKDNFDISILFGKNNFKSRINPGIKISDLSIKNNVFSIGGNLFYKDINIHYMNLIYSQEFDYLDIYNMMSLTNSLGEYLQSRQNYILTNQPNYEMNNIEHNIGFDFSIKNIDCYFERSVIYYNKILGERISGYRQYSSIYFNFYSTDFFIEYKNYNAPFLYSVFSNPPIGFRESSSVLSSRNLHSINFNNEYGYQFEINKQLNNSINLLISYALGLHHNEEVDDPTIDRSEYFPFADFTSIDKFSDSEPFKQLYIELNGWNKNEKLYYKFGYDRYYEITDLKSIDAITTPMQFAYKFNQGNSLTFYLEFQNKKEISTFTKKKFIYFSPSYNHFGKWSFTLFFDHEKSKKTWRGIDYTLNMRSSSKISFFYGSQKGGLVCANGSCVQQPDFERGLKVTFLKSL